MARFWSLAILPLALAAPARAQDVVEEVITDAFGNIRVILDEQGNVLERHDYLPFGEECTTGPCASNPGVGAGQGRKFTGKERDAETGLDYFGARYYSAPTGRFTTVDPVYTWRENLLDPQRWNRYAYARNNPLRYKDPDGRLIETIADVGFIGYDLFDIGRSVFRGEGVSGTQWGALGADVLGAAIPFATGGGIAVRAATKVDDVIDAGRGLGIAGDASKVAPTGVPKPGSAAGPGAGKRATPGQRQEALRENAGQCVFCDAPAAEADHAIPKSRGGDTTTGPGGNLQPTCQHCNRQKGAKTSQEYVDWKARQEVKEPNQ